MHIKLIAFLITVSISLANTTFASPILDALNNIKDAKPQEAANLLENSFMTNSSKIDKIDVALLILTLEEIQLKQPKHYYASFVLDNSKLLNSQQLTNFLQIAIDGYFKKGDFKRAQKYSLIALSAKDLSMDFKNTVQYQLAWILVNQNKYGEAISELEKLLNSTNNSIFRDKVVQDLGLFEGETCGKNQKCETHFKHESQNEFFSFVKGFAKGLNRWKAEIKALDIKVKIKDPELREELSRYYARNLNSQKSSVCSQIQFYNNFSLKTDDEPYALKNLAECFKNNKQYNVNEMIALYDQIKDRSFEIYPFVQILNEKGDQQKSCLILDQIFRQATNNLNERKALFNDLSLRCFKTVSLEKKWEYLNIAVSSKDLQISTQQKQQMLKKYFAKGLNPQIFTLDPSSIDLLIDDPQLAYLLFDFIDKQNGIEQIPKSNPIKQFYKTYLSLIDSITKNSALKTEELMNKLPSFLAKEIASTDIDVLNFAIEFQNQKMNINKNNNSVDIFSRIKDEIVKTQKIKMKIAKLSRKTKYPFSQKILKTIWISQLNLLEVQIGSSEKSIPFETFETLKKLIKDWKSHA